MRTCSCSTSSPSGRTPVGHAGLHGGPFDRPEGPRLTAGDPHLGGPAGTLVLHRRDDPSTQERPVARFGDAWAGAPTTGPPPTAPRRSRRFWSTPTRMCGSRCTFWTSSRRARSPRHSRLPPRTSRMPVARRVARDLRRLDLRGQLPAVRPALASGRDGDLAVQAERVRPGPGRVRHAAHLCRLHDGPLELGLHRGRGPGQCEPPPSQSGAPGPRAPSRSMSGADASRSPTPHPRRGGRTSEGRIRH